MALIDPFTSYPDADSAADAPPAPATRAAHILDPGFDLTLRPMRYPDFYEMYRDAIKNTWTVDEIDFSDDLVDLDRKLMPAERHLVSRLVAFFATGDSIVSNNLVLNLYQHINAPEARMYLSRQLYEEALHVQFYLTLLDNYIPDMKEREAAFSAVENIPSIRAKAEFCFKWIDSIQGLQKIETPEQRKQFLLNLICFATCIEGLFFFAAFDTTIALVLSCFYMLSEDQGLRDKLRKDLHEKTFLKGEKSLENITLEDLDRSDVMEMFVKEVLRLRGPATGAFPRVVTKPFKKSI